MNEQLKERILLRNKERKHTKGKWTIPNDLLVNDIINATQFLPNDAKIQERIHCILNDIDYIVMCQNENCNNPSGFSMKTYKYKKYCCPKCSNTSKSKIELTKKVYLEKYGVENPMQNEEIKKLSSENNPTHQDGYDNSKYKQSMLEKYGVSHPMYSEKIKNKLKNTMLEKYGVENIMQLESMQNKFSKEYLNKSLEKFKEELNKNNYKLLNLDNEFKGKDNVIYKFKCLTCETEFENKISCYRLLPICPKCNNVKEGGVSGLEKEIRDYIKTIYNDEILYNQKNLLKNRFEIDIFLPKLNIGFEVNGLYYHSIEMGKDENYHINKRNLALEKNIDLIQIFEDEWNSDKENIQNLILSKINNIKDNYNIIKNNEIIEIFNDNFNKVMECKINNSYIFNFKFLQPVNFKSIFNLLKDNIKSFYLEDDLRFNYFSFLKNQYEIFDIPPYKWIIDLHLRNSRYTSLNNPYEGYNCLSIYDCGYKIYNIN